MAGEENGITMEGRVTRIRDSFWLLETSIIAKIQGVFLVNIRLVIPLHSGTILPLNKGKGGYRTCVLRNS